MRYKNYVIEAEEVYNKDYQVNEYRGIILDENDNIIERCDMIRRNSENAIIDAKELVDKKYSKEGQEFFDTSTKKKWIANKSNNYMKILAYVIIAIIILFIAFALFGEIAMSVLVIYIFVLPFILIFSQKKQIIDFGTFIYDNGLYLVMFNNTNIAGANILSNLGAGGLGAAYAIKGIENNENYLKYATSINDFTKLTEKPLIWKFTSIKNVIKLNSNSYKIQAEYIDIVKNKTKHITFKLENRYDNFEDLVRTIYYLK